jgi:hypothetical protein
MHDPKANPLPRQRQQSQVERLFGKDPPPPPSSPSQPVAQAAEPAAEGDVSRLSYLILRGRIESPPALELRNRRGQARLIPWNYFGGASLDHPGELVLTFDGPAGPCQVTVSGRGLNVDLLEGVKEQRVSWIQELDELAAAAVARTDPAEPVVTGIRIEGGGREWSRGAAPAP